MRRVGIMVHVRRQDAMTYAVRAAEFLRGHGVEVYVEEEAAAAVGARPLKDAEQVDVMISLGGDGTLLRAAQHALRWDAALLGINLGRVGFLAEVEPPEIEDALTALIDGAFVTEKRPALRICTVDKTWFAINDAVVFRGTSPRLTTINAWVDGELAGRYAADGMVVATPTGSTGYSLSAGGPIVAPNVDCMVITPICAHTLHHRPTVVHGGACVTLELLEEDEQTALLQVDGQSRAELHAGMRVQIRMDERQLRLVRIGQQQFFQLVRDKLTEWTR